jgi:hypothetical protein
MKRRTIGLTVAVAVGFVAVCVFACGGDAPKNAETPPAGSHPEPVLLESARRAMSKFSPIASLIERI